MEKSAADVAREKDLLGQRAQQMSDTYEEAKDARERAKVNQTKKEQTLEALERKLDRNRAQQVRDAVRTHEELQELRQREYALRQQTLAEENSMQAATELLRQRHQEEAGEVLSLQRDFQVRRTCRRGSSGSAGGNRPAAR